MKNLNLFLKQLVLFLVLLLVPLVHSFSEDLLPNPETMTQEEIWMELGKNSAEREQLLDEREILLNERENNLGQKEITLNDREKLLKERENSVNEIERYTQNLREDNFWENLEWFLIGGALGLCGGFSFGVKLQL